MKTIHDLFKQIDDENFESHATFLKHCIAYHIVKDLLKDRMMEDIPEKYIRNYNLDEPTNIGEGKTIWFSPDGRVRKTNFDLQAYLKDDL